MVALVAVVGGALALGPSTAAAPGVDRSGAVVLIGTGGISWSDVSEETTPNLWGMLRDGSSAALSIRSVWSNTCPADGWLGLSAGARAGAPRTGEAADPANRPCTGPPTVTGDRVTEWPQYEAQANSEKFDSRLGLLSEQLGKVGLCVRAVGPYAPLGAAAPTGGVTRWSEWDSEQLVQDLNACPVTLVDVGAVRDPDEVAPGEATTGTREEQLRAIDTKIGQALEAGPNGADFLVASLSDAGTAERLRLVVARGPHFGPGTLVSGSTRQDGLAQAQDLTATILDRVGADVPEAVGGAPLTTNPAPDSSPTRAAARLAALRDYEDAAHEVHGLVEPFFSVFSYGQLVIYLAVLLLWKGRLGSEATRTTWLRRVRTLAVVAAAVPVSTFLANLLPWWRFPVPMLSVVASVGLFVTLLSLLALRPAWGQRALGPVAVVSTVTVLVLAVDVMTGSRLQLSSLMGLQPVVAGRFYGMGNPTFALFATAALLLATAVSSVLVARGLRKPAAIAVGVIGLVALVVDGAPFWGADGGGPPALLPAVVYLVLAVLGLKVTWKRALLILLGVVGVFFAVAGLDWLRPPASRTHLGRFVQSMIDGTADDIVIRKAQQNYDILTGNMPLTLLVPVALVFVIYLIARPTSWGSRAMQRSYDAAPTLRPGLVALLVCLTIGFAVNDSGVAIPAVGATLAVPLIVSVSLTHLLDEAREQAPTRAERRRRRPRPTDPEPATGRRRGAHRG